MSYLETLCLWIFIENDYGETSRTNIKTFPQHFEHKSITVNGNALQRLGKNMSKTM